MKKRTPIAAAVLVMALASSTVWATSAYISGKVTRTLVDADYYGGCMAALSEDPKNVLPGCGAQWVSFSCTGDFVDQTLALRMFDQAQLALATNKPAFLLVDDSRTHNGYCFASRIDVIQ